MKSTVPDGKAGGRLIFSAGRKRYALPLRHIREIRRLPLLTPVPLTPAGLLGLANIRGETLAILSPLALSGQAPDRKADQLLVLEGEERIALAIDRVERIEPAGSGAPTHRSRIAELPLEALIAAVFPVRDPIRRTGHSARYRVPAAERREDLPVAMLRFAIGEQSFALPLEDIDEVLRVPADIARLPDGDAAAIGTIAWRATSLGVLSLARLLGLGEDDRNRIRIRQGRSHARILVVALGSHRLGLLVDRIEGLLKVMPGQIDEVPAALLPSGGETRIRALCRPEAGKLVSVLAADRLLNEPRTRRLLTGAARKTDTSDIIGSRSGERLVMLPVRIGAHRLAVPLAAIERVAPRPSQITPVPGTPAWLTGIAMIAGEPLVIVDQAFRLTGVLAKGKAQRLLVIRARNQRIGFLVDQASTLLQVEASALSPTPLPDTLAGGIFGEILQCPQSEGDETPAILLLLSPEALISSAEQALIAECVPMAPVGAA